MSPVVSKNPYYQELHQSLIQIKADPSLEKLAELEHKIAQILKDKNFIELGFQLGLFHFFVKDPKIKITIHLLKDPSIGPKSVGIKAKYALKNIATFSKLQKYLDLIFQCSKRPSDLKSKKTLFDNGKLSSDVHSAIAKFLGEVDLSSLFESDPSTSIGIERELRSRSPEYFSTMVKMPNPRDLECEVHLISKVMFNYSLPGSYIRYNLNMCAPADRYLVRTPEGDKEYTSGTYQTKTGTCFGCVDDDGKQPRHLNPTFWQHEEAMGANWPILFMEYQRPDLTLESAQKKLSEKGPRSYLICNGPIRDVFALCAYPGNTEDIFLFSLFRREKVFQQVILEDKAFNKVGNSYPNFLGLLNHLKAQHPGKFTNIVRFLE
jgi:hypothetical protein